MENRSGRKTTFNKQNLKVSYTATLPKNSDQLHNQNCHDYLAKIYEKIEDNHSLLKNISDSIIYKEKERKIIVEFLLFLKKFITFFHTQSEYNAKNAYGDFYTAFLLEFEQHALKLLAMREIWIKKLQIQENINQQRQKLLNFQPMDEIIHLIFANPNESLERSGETIESVLDQEGLKHEDLKHSVKKRLRSNIFSISINTITPEKVESPIYRFFSNLIDRRDFKPGTTTSISAKRNYDHKIAVDPIEIRFGTQGQIDNGVYRINPTFELWLQSLWSQRYLHEGKPTYSIDHIYFNNLPLDQSGFTRTRERKISEQLHDLEKRHDNLAVITLPADKGLMDKKFLKHHEKVISREKARDLMFRIASQDKSELANLQLPPILAKAILKKKPPKEIRDFNISPKVIALLNDLSGESFNVVIDRLLNKSFDLFGFSPGQALSPAELQAVYFHFIKFELTDFINTTLKPKSFNMACKDAIDRGGVSSAYYNLIKSLERPKAMTKEEFDRALHAAPALVKARGMNHQSTLIWNTLNHYANANSTALKNKIPDWLDKWLNDFKVKGSREALIEKLKKYAEKNATKSATADKLKYVLFVDKTMVFNKDEFSELKSGGLKTIYKEIKQLGLLPKGFEEKQIFKHTLGELDNYITNASQSKYSFTLWRRFNISFSSLKYKTSKQEAAKKLLAHYNREHYEAFTPEEYEALREKNSRLAKLHDKLEKNNPSGISDIAPPKKQDLKPKQPDLKPMQPGRASLST